MTTYTISLAADKKTDVLVDEFGNGQPFLVLHGGAGPFSVAGLAKQLAASDHARAIVPTHPGFGGTTRPDWLNSVRLLAQLYVALIEQLDLHDVTVIGSSIGGWIAAEIALCHSSRISNFILIDAAGISVEGQPVVVIFQITPDQLAKRSFHNPAAFFRDPSTMSDAE